MPSLTDVAREAGVSLTTASMVLNKGKQHNRVSLGCAQRVQEVAKKLGYVPNYHARSMKLGRAEVLAVALDTGFGETGDGFTSAATLELSNPYLGRLISGIQMRIRVMGYLMTLVGPDANACAQDRAMTGVKQRRFDGVIVPGMAVRSHLSKFLEEPADCPVVVIESPVPTPHVQVTFDDAAGIEAAISHLAGLGHLHIAYVGERESHHAAQRESHFNRICHNHNIHPSILHLNPLSNMGLTHPDKQISEVAKEFSAMISAGQFNGTAILAGSDAIAVGVMEALTSAGMKIPADVSVVGFDNTIAPYATPRLTSISHELAEMGRLAVDLCMRMVNAPAEINALRGTTHTVKPRFVERASTTKARINSHA